MITPEERERSYERYVLYRQNRIRYEAPGDLIILIAIVGGFVILFKFGLNFNLLMAFLIIVVFGGAILLAYFGRKTQVNSKAPKDTTEDIKKLISSPDVKIVEENGKSITVSLPADKADEIVTSIKSNANTKGIDVNIRKVNVEKNMNVKSTDIGYVNKNNQRNNGKTNQRGSGLNQWFYEMECLDCGHKYMANGHDIWLRKCPNCQGGQP